MAESDTDRRGVEPPDDFAVMRESDLDAERGRATHWLYRGQIGERRFIRPGYTSRAEACRAAWMIFRMALPEDVRAERRLAQRRAREHWRRHAWVDPLGMRALYMVRLDTWEHMEADLLSQLIDDAGSIRRAAIVLDVPRSTLSARVRGHRERGTWPQ